MSPTDPTCTPFRPFFPSNSPYVLSVGSTFLTPNALPVCDANVTSPVPLPVFCTQVRVLRDMQSLVVQALPALRW